MACYHPIPAAQDNRGDRPRFAIKGGEETLQLPCGNCVGCKSARATMWAQRATHEASSWPHNSFLTLTYDERHVPLNGFLNRPHLTSFFKHLRHAINRSPGDVLSDGSGRLRYLACGEYGDVGGRPHFHAILFNFALAGGEPVSETAIAHPFLRKVWPYGLHQLAPFAPAAANYIAQYTLKKSPKGAPLEVDNETGENKPEPYLRMSNRPGIGTPWLDKYMKDLRKGFITVDGQRHPIPRAYLQRLKRSPIASHNALAEEISYNSYLLSQSQSITSPTDHKGHPDRLRASEAIHIQKKQRSEHRTL